MTHKTTFVDYPVDTPSDIMIKFHIETIKKRRWDLVVESRLYTLFCLN